MNSVLDVVLTNIDSEQADHVFQQICTLADQYERMLSCHSPEAEIFQLNEKAVTCFSPVGAELFYILVECKQLNESTNGYFDIGLKKVKENLVTVGCGIKTVQFGVQQVCLGNKNTAFDLGAVGKGILLRKVEEFLRLHQIKNGFISFGGSSILAFGTHPHGYGWPVTLRVNSARDFSINLENSALSVSESYLESSGKPHIINPYILNKAEKKLLSIVQCNDPVKAEAVSTALIIAPEDERDDILRRNNIIKAYIFNKNQSAGICN